MKKLNLAFLFGATLSLSALAWAQNPEPPPAIEYFRLEFNLKELEGGKLINTRNFQMMARTGDRAQSNIRAGGRVPVNSGERQYTYIDVGINLDVDHLTRVKDELAFDVTGSVSGSVEPTTPPVPPLIRQTQFGSKVLVPLRKPTMIFSSDDPASKHQLQLEVTATPIH